MLLEDLVKLFPIMVVRNNRHWKLLTFSQKFTSTESLMVFRQQEFSSLLHNIVLQLGKQKIRSQRHIIPRNSPTDDFKMTLASVSSPFYWLRAHHKDYKKFYLLVMQIVLA